MIPKYQNRLGVQRLTKPFSSTTQLRMLLIKLRETLRNDNKHEHKTSRLVQQGSCEIMAEGERDIGTGQQVLS